MTESRVHQLLQEMGYKVQEEPPIGYRPTPDEEEILRNRHAKHFGRCEAPLLKTFVESNPVYQQPCDICGKMHWPDTNYLFIVYGGQGYDRTWNYIICLDRDACLLRAAVLTDKPRLWYEEGP